MRRTPNKGRRVLSSLAAFTTVSGFVFDRNRPHLHDPDWPPHARFHAARSVVSASLLGAAGSIFCSVTARTRRRTSPWTRSCPRSSNLYQAASFAFPGAKGAEYQFPEKIPQVRGVWLNERFFSAAT